MTEATIQAEFYHQARLVGVTCVLEYHTPRGRLDIAIFNSDHSQLLAIVECKNSPNVSLRTRQFDRYRSIGVPVFMLNDFDRAKALLITFENTAFPVHACNQFRSFLGCDEEVETEGEDGQFIKNSTHTLILTRTSTSRATNPRTTVPLHERRMNNADIEAARRLIAQFEGTALGRHNSSTWRENPVAPEESTYPTQARGRWIPEQHRMVTLRDGPQDCRVGEYCFMVGRRIPDDLAIFRFIPPVNLKRFVEFNDTPSPEFDVWEFERVWLVDRRWPERRRMAWHRIA